MTSINIRKLSHSEMDLYRKPLLPETWSCFPVDKDIDTQQLRKILQRDLDKIRSGAEKDPFSTQLLCLHWIYPEDSKKIYLITQL